MPTLHIANTQFEWELQNGGDLQTSLHSHPLHIQLQFLPFLYAQPEDYVLLFHKPPQEYFENLKKIRSSLPKPIYFDQLDLQAIDKVESWGASQAIVNWAKQHHLTYDIPDLSLVKTIAAKTFTYERTSKLPNAAALHNKEELMQWIERDFWPKVLKANYGTAGRGHRIIRCKTALHYNEILPFCDLEWSRGLAVIGEPWMKRQNDFSTQWHLGDSIDFLGSTIMECSDYGTYRSSTIASLQNTLHMPLLEEIHKLGYFGFVGIDGFTYEERQHITEINPRKTMGWVALKLCQILNQPKLKIEFKQPQAVSVPLLPFSVENGPKFKLQLDLMLPA